ncbi:MAG TPA: hypothetical protein PLX89_06170 [Verrucomicrobiota bacterium]|nr:hypothetical protein [Verrucomicrobiales bacterium]HRI12576.1 hypothetical protein [Verrucomicrobiota bacterium]
MHDYHAFRHAAIRYWERRRIIYNVALLPPSALIYMLTAGFSRAGDDYGWHPYYVLLLFLFSALGANICYTFAYALEFLFGSDDPASRWLRLGRSTAFASGLAFAILLAAVGGKNIALMEFYLR